MKKKNLLIRFPAPYSDGEVIKEFPTEEVMYLNANTQRFIVMGTAVQEIGVPRQRTELSELQEDCSC